MTKPNPTTAITRFLTDEEIASAIALFKTAELGTFAKLCEKQIIAPVLPRIEKTLGQRMNPRYVAYMVEYVLGRAGERTDAD